MYHMHVYKSCWNDVVPVARHLNQWHAILCFEQKDSPRSFIPNNDPLFIVPSDISMYVFCAPTSSKKDKLDPRTIKCVF